MIQALKQRWKSTEFLQYRVLGFFFLNGLGMGVDVEKIIPNWGMMNKNVELQIIEKMAHSF